MRFDKTVGDIQMLQQNPNHKVGWSEALDLMLNILLDIRTETNRELKDLDVNDEAVAKWRAVATARLSVPVEAAAQGMAERSRTRLEALRERLAEEAAAVSDTEQQTAQCRLEEQQLHKQLDDNKEKYKQLEQLQQTVEELRHQISALERDISEIQDVNEDEMKAAVERLRLKKEEKKKQSDTYEDYVKRLQAAAEECVQLEESIAEEREKLRLADEELQKSREELNGVEAQRREKDIRKTQLDSECERLRQDMLAVDADIRDRQKDIEACNNEIVEKNIELNKQKGLLLGAQSSRDNVEQQTRIAREKKEELENEAAQLKRELDEVSGQIADLESQNSELKASLDDSKETLSQKIKNKDEEIQRLTQEVNGLNERITQADRECRDLCAKKSADEESLEECNTRLQELQESIKRIEEETEDCKAQKQKLWIRQQHLTEQKQQYAEDIQKYQDFFNSDECRETQDTIAQYSRVIEVYQNGINALFNKSTITYAEQLADLDDSYQAKKYKLKQELDALRMQLDMLSTDYLYVVYEIERKVKL